jgi:hypothetical protein
MLHLLLRLLFLQNAIYAGVSSLEEPLAFDNNYEW